MKRSVLALCVLTLLTLVPVSVRAEESAAARDARMTWWREARFGMFVHWGLYSGLGGVWKGKHMRLGAEWIQQRAGADPWEYAHETIPLFRPKEGFADAWAELAATAGCKYIVFTTKHHDGFALHNSSVTTYDAVDITGRDLCREITDATRKQGLKVGYYHSVIDWHHPQYDYTRAHSLPYPLKGRRSPNGKRDHDIYLDYLHHQVNELMSNYGPVDIIWWDFSKKGAEGEFWRADDLLKQVREKQPRIISNNRLYHIEAPHKSHHLVKIDYAKGDIVTPEQHIPATGLPGVDWETCMTMNGSWGYSAHDRGWKPDKKLIRNLIDIVSKGGNYLLNIGPKGDGSIPEESVERMVAIGKWMDVNGESIYGTTASPFDAPKWGRFTAKGDVIYAHIFNWPEDGKLVMPLPKGDVKRAYLLADVDRRALDTETGDNTLRVKVPAQAPDPIATVIVLELGN